MSPLVFLSLGSNLGPRQETLEAALLALASGGFAVERRSSLYATEPVGGPPQEWFLNQVIGGEAALAPEALLAACLAAEQEQGRVRTVPGGPRTLDADLLLYGDEVREDGALSLPHPRLHQRRFVLVPLVEVAPAARHPRLGLTAQELLARCPDRSQVRRYSLAVRR